MTKRLSKSEKESRHLQRMLKHIEQTRAYAATKNGRLLSSKINGKKDFVDWECSAGHIFEKRFSNMKHRKQFCSKCEGGKVIKRKYK